MNDQAWHDLGMEELFIREFGNERKHEVLGICEKDRPKPREGDNGQAVQGQQPTAILSSGTHD